MNNKNENLRKSPLYVFFLRIFVSQIVNSMLYFLAASLLWIYLDPEYVNSAPYYLAISLLAMIHLAYSLYSYAWKMGERDQNIVKYGHMKFVQARGLKAGALSQIPGILLAFYAGFSLYAFEVITPFIWLKSIYFPFYWLFLIFDSPIMVVFAVALVPLFAHWGYELGYNLTGIREMLLRLKNKDKS